MANRKGKSGISDRFYFLELQETTVDSDFSLEIKKLLLLGRKAVTNLGSVFKSRDNSLLTKVCIVKAMVFPVAVYGCELDHKEGWVLKN